MASSQKPRRDVPDERFLRVQKDPRFWEMPEKQTKVQIDKRFQAMFHDQRFTERHTVDKRGRAVQRSTKEDLKKFYQLSDSEDESGPRPGLKKDRAKAGLKPGLQQDRTKPGLQQDRSRPGLSAEDEDKDDEDDEDEGLSEDSGQDSTGAESESGSGLDSEDSDSDLDSGPDLARGKGNVETSSEDDSEDDSEDEVEAILRREEQQIQHDWGDLCKDAPRTEEVSRRLAVCNMDWDRIKAKDLLALFTSFCPKGGAVLSVKVFLSDFGKERVQQEQSHAPLELKPLPDDSEDDTEEEKLYRERLRGYQFQRLKYRYAVVECDADSTAARLYDLCDGYEYESSGSVLDLRFVPDDMQFEDQPNDEATDMSLNYTPKLFTSTAASTSKVELTWDETDHERVTALNRNFNKDELLNMDFTAYLASSSEGEEPEGEEPEEPEGAEPEKPEGAEPEEGADGGGEACTAEGRSLQTERAQKKKHGERQLEKYRALLKDVHDRERQQEHRGVEMEVTWVPGLKESAEQRVKKRLEASEKLSPWDQYLQKKQEQKKQKRKLRRKQDSEAGLSDDVPSDVDLNDPFFRDELPPEMKKNLKKEKKRRRRVSDEEEEQTEEELRQKAQMELLMEDGPDEEQHQHFDFDRIVEQQNLSKNQKKRLRKSGLQPQEDQFQVDVCDPRFEAVYTSALFNLDPSHPDFRSTRGTQSLLQEKQRRRQDSHGPGTSPASVSMVTTTAVSTVTASATGGLDPGLSQLVKSIKSKTQQHQERRKTRPQ